jgi:hypothetical protein
LRDGSWQVTHQGIAIDTEGNLLDGQHRLYAVIESGVSVSMTVSRGVDIDTRSVVDCGATRVSHDRVTLSANINVNRHLCMVVCAYVRCALREKAPFSAVQIEDAYLKFADSWAWVVSRFPEKGRDGLLRGPVQAAVGIYHSIDFQRAEAFADGYLSGAGLPERSPILALRSGIGSMPGHDPANYWKAVTATRAHLERRDLAKLHSATVDLVGNQNVAIAEAQMRRGLKAAKTRQLNGQNGQNGGEREIA